MDLTLMCAENEVKSGEEHLQFLTVWYFKHRWLCQTCSLIVIFM